MQLHIIAAFAGLTAVWATSPCLRDKDLELYFMFPGTDSGYYHQYKDNISEAAEKLHNLFPSIKLGIGQYGDRQTSTNPTDICFQQIFRLETSMKGFQRTLWNAQPIRRGEVVPEDVFTGMAFASGTAAGFSDAGSNATRILALITLGQGHLDDNPVNPNQNLATHINCKASYPSAEQVKNIMHSSDVHPLVMLSRTSPGLDLFWLDVIHRKLDFTQLEAKLVRFDWTGHGFVDTLVDAVKGFECDLSSGTSQAYSQNLSSTSTKAASSETTPVPTASSEATPAASSETTPVPTASSEATPVPAASSVESPASPVPSRASLVASRASSMMPAASTASPVAAQANMPHGFAYATVPAVQVSSKITEMSTTQTAKTVAGPGANAAATLSAAAGAVVLLGVVGYAVIASRPTPGMEFADEDEEFLNNEGTIGGGTYPSGPNEGYVA